MRHIGRFIGAALAALLLGACSAPAPEPGGGRATNSEKYARDREACRGQVDEYMRTRRDIDDSRRDVYSGERERFGQSGLPTQMDAYGDSRRSDRVMNSCMEGRGWPAPKSWWQRIGS